MNIKRVLFLGGVSLTLISSVVGCSFQGDDVRQNLKSQAVYYTDNSSGELKADLIYNRVGRLVEITLPKEVEIDTNTEIYVKTQNDVYPATIAQGKLMYIGQAPEESNPIKSVYYIKVEKTIIKREELKNVGKGYEFRYPIKDVNGISINPGQEAFIEMIIEDNDFVAIIPNEIYSNSKTFELTVRKNVKIEI